MSKLVSTKKECSGIGATKSCIVSKDRCLHAG